MCLFYRQFDYVSVYLNKTEVKLGAFAIVMLQLVKNLFVANRALTLYCRCWPLFDVFVAS